MRFARVILGHLLECGVDVLAKTWRDRTLEDITQPFLVEAVRVGALPRRTRPYNKAPPCAKALPSKARTSLSISAKY
jgi:hypothetical protein